MTSTEAVPGRTTAPTCTTHCSCSRRCQRSSIDVQPTHVVVYNPLYPVQPSWRRSRSVDAAFALVGCPRGRLHPEPIRTGGRLPPHLREPDDGGLANSIHASLEVPCTPVEVAAVGRHLRELMGGGDPWVYSAAPTATGSTTRGVRWVRPTSRRRRRPALQSGRDALRRCWSTPSTYRDAGAGYSDIAEFIAAIRGAAELLPAVDFVMRLHPRLLPNKRETVTSPDLAPIMAALSDLPPNVHVNRPTRA